MLPRLGSLLERVLGVGSNAPYKGAHEVEAKRFVSAREASDRKVVELGEAMVKEATLGQS